MNMLDQKLKYNRQCKRTMFYFNLIFYFLFIYCVGM